MDDIPIYYEEQKFNQVWLWVLLLFLAVLGWYIPLETVLAGPDKDALTIGIVLFVWILAGILLPLLFGMLKLESEVRSDGVYVRYFPFHMNYRSYHWDEIKSAEPVEYRPILDYGGWGIRYGSKGKAYNVSGKEGVLLSFKDGRRDLLIGSRHPLEFAGSIRTSRRRRK